MSLIENAMKNRHKHEVSDPAYYNALIAKQKSRVRKNPADTMEWLELGRLYDARIDMIVSFAKRHFAIRYAFHLNVFLFLIAFVLVKHYMIPIFSTLESSGIVIISTATIVMIASFLYNWTLRYPPSGVKYFKKAIGLDPHNGEAYMYLGLIALRRRQKRKACRLLETAVRLNTSNKNKIEQKLKSVYEKEFAAFFQKRSEKEIMQQETIDHQLEQIKLLRSKNADLEKRVESLSTKLDRAKWEIGNQAKLLDKELQNGISKARQDYEKKITLMQEEAKAEAKELAERDFLRLTTEIMESKASLEGQSFAASGRMVENIMGKRFWRKLSEQTRTYIATAGHVYTLITEKNESPDYSMVGMELCKALETEINRRLVVPFPMYLNGNESEFLRINQTGEHKDKPSYFTYLAKVVDQLNYPEFNSLTLGQYHFVLKLTLENDYALKEYGNFLDKINTKSEIIIGKTFLTKLETVVKRYRNMIAHQSPMNKIQYDHLDHLVFSGDGALLKICSKIKR